MKDGLYVLEFSSSIGAGNGVITLRDNKFAGGDSAILYRGTITHDGINVSAKGSFARHSAGLPSVMGAEAGTYELNGAGDDLLAKLKGASHQAPDVAVSVQIRRIGDL